MSSRFTTAWVPHQVRCSLQNPTGARMQYRSRDVLFAWRTAVASQLQNTTMPFVTMPRRPAPKVDVVGRICGAAPLTRAGREPQQRAEHARVGFEHGAPSSPHISQLHPTNRGAPSAEAAGRGAIRLYSPASKTASWYTHTIGTKENISLFKLLY